MSSADELVELLKKSDGNRVALEEKDGHDALVVYYGYGNQEAHCAWVVDKCIYELMKKACARYEANND